MKLTELLLALLEELVNNCCESRAYERTNDEYPYASDSVGVTVESCNNSRTDRTCGVHGSTCQTDTEDMYQCEGKTDDQTAEAAVISLLGSNAEDSHNKDECQHYLNDKSCNCAAAYAAEAVAAEAAGFICNAAKIKDSSQYTCACECAEALGNDIADKILDSHSACHKNAKGNCRVYVAARNVADTVSHTNDNKTESKCCQDIAAALFSTAANQHCGTAAEDNKNSCADKLGNILLHNKNLHVQ